MGIEDAPDESRFLAIGPITAFMPIAKIAFSVLAAGHG